VKLTGKKRNPRKRHDPPATLY